MRADVEVLSKVCVERFASVELHLHLAAAALDHVRHASLARPLPLEPAAARAALAPLRSLGPSSSLADLSSDSLSLLGFLVRPDVVGLRKSSVSKWAASGSASARKFLPDAVFEIDYGLVHDEHPNALARRKHAEFCLAQKNFPTRVAYHGTELCNLHNVLREGLKNDPKFAGRNGAVFGKGIYLSEELDVSMNFLSFGRGRDAGSLLACMLECEVVEDPSQVLVGDEEKASGVPSKYIIVKNDCLVRPRRLLVYHQKKVQSDYRWLGTLLAVMLGVMLLVLMLVKKNTIPVGRIFSWSPMK